MDAGASFCRLMLGDTAAAAAAADDAAPGSDAVDAVAGAWLACAPELARRRRALSWEEPAEDPALGPLAGRLATLPERERAAVVAQAVGLRPAELAPALGLEPEEGPGLLSRGHAALAGLGRPADRACAAEREELAADEARRGKASTSHCATCRAFAAALAEQRPALRAAAATARREARAGAGSSSPGRGRGVLEPRGRVGRTLVALAVTLAAGASTYGLVRVLDEEDGGQSGSGVITATPVGPLPPGVNAPP